MTNFLLVLILVAIVAGPATVYALGRLAVFAGGVIVALLVGALAVAAVVAIVVAIISDPIPHDWMSVAVLPVALAFPLLLFYVAGRLHDVWLRFTAWLRSSVLTVR